MTAAELIEAICLRGWDAPTSPRVSDVIDALRADPGVADGDVYAAAALGDVDALRALIEADPSLVNRAGGPRGWPPLLYAAFSVAHRIDGRAESLVECVRVLLAAGADPGAHYAADGATFSALYATLVVSDDVERARLLVDAGAPGSDGNSLYHVLESFDLAKLELLGRANLDLDDISYCAKHALDMQWMGAVKLLLAWGADPNAVHPVADETTLHWAVKRAASAEVVTLLLEAGADPNLRTKKGRAAFLGLRGWTPLDFALRLGRTDLADLLTDAGGVPSPPEPADVFVYACAAGRADEARSLLAAEPGRLEGLDPADRALLPHVAHQGVTEGVRVMAQIGFELDATSWMGLTALHWAAMRGDVEMTRALLDAGAELVDLGGWLGSPANCAREHRWWVGDHDAVIELLER